MNGGVHEDRGALQSRPHYLVLLLLVCLYLLVGQLSNTCADLFALGEHLHPLLGQRSAHRHRPAGVKQAVTLHKAQVLPFHLAVTNQPNCHFEVAVAQSLVKQKYLRGVPLACLLIFELLKRQTASRETILPDGQGKLQLSVGKHLTLLFGSRVEKIDLHLLDGVIFSNCQCAPSS